MQKYTDTFDVPIWVSDDAKEVLEISAHILKDSSSDPFEENTIEIDILDIQGHDISFGDYAQQAITWIENNLDLI